MLFSYHRSGSVLQGRGVTHRASSKAAPCSNRKRGQESGSDRFGGNPSSALSSCVTLWSLGFLIRQVGRVIGPYTRLLCLVERLKGAKLKRIQVTWGKKKSISLAGGPGRLLPLLGAQSPPHGCGGRRRSCLVLSGGHVSSCGRWSQHVRAGSQMGTGAAS